MNKPIEIKINIGGKWKSVISVKKFIKGKWKIIWRLKNEQRL